MRWDKETLYFTGNLNTIENRVQKALPAEFLFSDINYRFEVSGSDRPAEPFIANRYAPLVREIRTEGRFRKGVVIPKGTILSAQPLFTKDTYMTVAGPYGEGTASGFVGSGEIALGMGYNGAPNMANMDDMIEGYDILRIVGAIANGGAAVNDVYTDYDVQRQRVGRAGSLVASGDKFNRPANIPIGFVTQDIYLFDQGGKLNFTEGRWQRFSSFATQYFVEMPFIAPVSGDSLAANEMHCTLGGSDQTMGAAYAALYRIGIPFLRATTFGDVLPGAFVQSDYNGRYLMQYSTGSQVAPGVGTTSPLVGVRTAQTIGRLVSVTNKFPQDLEGLVETYNSLTGVNREIIGTGQFYPVTKVGGTATYGLDYVLFVFLYTILVAKLGQAPTYDDFKNLLNSGAVGIARINLCMQ